MEEQWVQDGGGAWRPQALESFPPPSICTADKYSTAELFLFLIDIFESVPA